MKFLNGKKTVIGVSGTIILVAAHTLITVDPCRSTFIQGLIENGIDFAIGGTSLLSLIGIIHKIEKAKS